MTFRAVARAGYWARSSCWAIGLPDPSLATSCPHRSSCPHSPPFRHGNALRPTSRTPSRPPTPACPGGPALSRAPRHAYARHAYARRPYGGGLARLDAGAQTAYVEAVRAVGQELAAERGRFDPGRHRAVTVSRRGGTADRYGTPDRTGTGMHRHWTSKQTGIDKT